MACNETALIVLFSQASIFSFPGLWRLRSVCRTWRDAIESTGVLSAHLAQRERISKLQGVEMTKEGLRDILLIDHIIDALRPYEDRGLTTANFRQSLRVSHMLRTLDRLALPAASAVCSLLGDVRVTVMGKGMAYSASGSEPNGSVTMALTALSIANAAADLSSELKGKTAAKIRIVIESLKDAREPIECLEDSLLIVPPLISSARACAAIARAIKVFERVQEIARTRKMDGASLVADVAGVSVVEEYSTLYSPKEQHLWLGMVLFPEEIKSLAGERISVGTRHGVSWGHNIIVPWHYFDLLLKQLE
eukprot:m51a1_g14100 hypothetical protein (307) ;mRNA; f:93192-94112